MNGIIDPSTLTEEQREAIRKEYNYYKDSWNEVELTETTMESFETLFGSDFFEKGGEK